MQSVSFGWILFVTVVGRFSAIVAWLGGVPRTSFWVVLLFGRGFLFNFGQHEGWLLIAIFALWFYRLVSSRLSYEWVFAARSSFEWVPGQASLECDVCVCQSL